MKIEVCRIENTTERDFWDEQRRIAKRWASQEEVDRESHNALNRKIYADFQSRPKFSKITANL